MTQWRHCSEALPGAALLGEGAESVDFCLADGLDDGWLVGAMAMIATRPELLFHLFALTEHLHRGILTLRIFKHGAWMPVTNDSTLPCGLAHLDDTLMTAE